MTDWYLGNAEEQHAANPHGFFIPTAERRHALEPGELVRLQFRRPEWAEGEPSGERMYVEIDRRDGGEYVANLTNQPVYIQDIKLGDEVRFGPEHVIEVDDPAWYPYVGKKAITNQRLLDDDALQPGYVIHEPPDREEDSGWQLFAGDEEPGELDDAKNFLLPDVSWLMERYPKFAELVFSEPGDGGWFRDPESGRYEKDPQT